MNPFYKNLSLWLVILLVFFMLFQIFDQHQNPSAKPISYSEFLAMVDQEQISEVTIQNQNLMIRDIQNQSYKSYAPDDPRLVEELRKKGVSITAKPPEQNHWIVNAIISWLPLIIIIGVWIFFMKQMQGGGGKAMSFGKSRAKLMTENTKKVTFDDVAGVDEAKEELTEIVEFLRDPKKFTRLGGRIPKGVLLTGSPGTGKTLLSRAVAGEAGVPFFSISGSDFVEMFVGVGASRVRDLFMQGKKNAPCIIFIDEIDAVGRQRGAGLGGGHDEREQTLNQLLVEMDGFESNEGVILIAATNRPDVLDPALLRPGRFDRQVTVPLPDVAGREKILKVHILKTPIGDDVNVRALAKGTPGFSGADLENVVNEAALIAAKKNKDQINMIDFEDAKDKVYMGLERKSKAMSEDEKKVTAYHEGGHALVARLLPNTDAVNKITIIPRGRAAGVTWFFPDESDFRYKDQLESSLCVAFGGRIAEDIIFNRISTGASNDIKQATNIAHKMVRSWGMSELGPLSFSKDDDQVFLGREIAHSRDYSEDTARKIDEAVTNIINSSYKRAENVLKENMSLLHKLADLLLEKETVMGAELDELILSEKPDFEFSSKIPSLEDQEPLKPEEPSKETVSEGADDYKEETPQEFAQDETKPEDDDNKTV